MSNLLHFQKEMVHFFFKNDALRSESVNILVIIILSEKQKKTFNVKILNKINNLIENNKKCPKIFMSVII